MRRQPTHPEYWGWIEVFLLSGVAMLVALFIHSPGNWISVILAFYSAALREEDQADIEANRLACQRVPSVIRTFLWESNPFPLLGWIASSYVQSYLLGTPTLNVMVGALVALGFSLGTPMVFVISWLAHDTNFRPDRASLGPPVSIMVLLGLTPRSLT